MSFLWVCQFAPTVQQHVYPGWLETIHCHQVWAFESELWACPVMDWEPVQGEFHASAGNLYCYRLRQTPSTTLGIKGIKDMNDEQAMLITYSWLYYFFTILLLCFISISHHPIAVVRRTLSTGIRCSFVWNSPWTHTGVLWSVLAERCWASTRICWRACPPHTDVEWFTQVVSGSSQHHISSGLGIYSLHCQYGDHRLEKSWKSQSYIPQGQRCQTAEHSFVFCAQRKKEKVPMTLAVVATQSMEQTSAVSSKTVIQTRQEGSVWPVCHKQTQTCIP